MDWSYESWPSGEPYDWGGAARGDSIYAATDFHVDLGCGKLKKGRIGIDHYAASGVNIIADLDKGYVFGMAEEPGADAEYQSHHECGLQGYHWLPFADGEIESIVSHHALEHIGTGFLPLIDEVYRVLKPGGLFYAITPLFPSHTAVADADHKRYFMDTTWDAFCGWPGDEPNQCWLASFSVPYTRARFEKVDQDMSPSTPLEQQWTKEDAREIRVALKAVK